MAKKFVTITLATKLRLLFGGAVLLIIAAALVVPWYFMELIAEYGLQKPGAELTRLAFNEFVRNHPENRAPVGGISALYTAGQDVSGRAGPALVKLSADLKPLQPLDSPARRALRAFIRNPDQDLTVLPGDSEQGAVVYRCLRAIRVEQSCMSCHGPTAQVEHQFQLGRLVGMIDLTMPPSAASGSQVCGSATGR